MPENRNALAIFRTVPTITIAVDDHGGMVVPQYNLNTIGNLDNTEGYRVLNQGAQTTLTILGSPMDVNRQFTLQPNRWNFMGYPFDHPVSPVIALSSITANIDMVQTDDSRMYIPRYNFNTIGMMQPGEGYRVMLRNTNVNIIFTFNDVGLMAYEEEAYELPVAEGAPLPTGLPYTVLVRFSDELLAMNPATVDLYDGSLLVGKGIVLDDLEFTPVTAWGGASEYNLSGFQTGNEISYVVKNASGVKLPAVSENAEPLIFGQGAFAELSLGEVPMPTEFVVEQGYPNPFNPVVTVPFALPSTGEVTFTVFNVLGQQLATASGQYEAGHHRFVFDAGQSGSDLVSGVYFLQVRFKDQVSMQKLLLLK